MWIYYLSSFLLFFASVSSFDTPCTSIDNNALPAITETFVINLNHRVDRLMQVTIQLAKLHVPFTRFEAISFGAGNEAAIAEAKKRMSNETKFDAALVGKHLEQFGNEHVTWGSTGCWQSHLQVYLQIASRPLSDGPFLILEDDVKVSHRLVVVLQEESLKTGVPVDWDVLLLDHSGLRCHEVLKLNHHSLCAVKFSYTTSAYVLRNSTVARVLAERGNTAGLQIADHYLNDLYASKTLHAYAFLPKVVAQARSVYATDIKRSGTVSLKLLSYDENI